MINPTLLNLNGLGTTCAITQLDNFVFPPSIRLNRESVESEKVALALLDDGVSLNLYLLE